LLLEHARQFRLILPEFFLEIRSEYGQLLSMLPLRKVLFSEPITDRHRALCNAIPYPCLLLSRDLFILDANAHYLSATFTDKGRIAGQQLFDAFPDNPNNPDADGVQNLSASLHAVLNTRQPHQMVSPQRYDIRRRSGRWLVRSWRPINVPVLDKNGEIVSIIHHVEKWPIETSGAEAIP
jgi:hypothetical protein